MSSEHNIKEMLSTPINIDATNPGKPILQNIDTE